MCLRMVGHFPAIDFYAPVDTRKLISRNINPGKSLGNGHFFRSESVFEPLLPL